MENYFVIFANPKRGKLDIIGSLAEWLGGGLQNRIRRFESARNLNPLQNPCYSRVLFLLYGRFYGIYGEIVYNQTFILRIGIDMHRAPPPPRASSDPGTVITHLPSGISQSPLSKSFAGIIWNPLRLSSSIVCTFRS